VLTALVPGKNEGESDVIVKVQNKPLLSAYVQADNQGARSTGDNKLSFNGTVDNPIGIGDQIIVNTNGTEGNAYAKLGYSMPVEHDGLRVGASTTYMQYKLLGDLATLKAKGDAQTYGVNASYPLIRSSTRNVNVSGAYDHKRYFNEANSVTTSEKKIDALILSVSGDNVDAMGAGGITQWSSNLTTGQLDLSATATNETADQNGPNTKGSYSKLSYSLFASTAHQ